MFEEFEKLAELGTVIFGNSNSCSVNYFCLWQQKNSFASTSGLLEDLELNDFNNIAYALEDCKCIPFGYGKTPVEAYNKMKAIFDKYFDDKGNWISYDFEYGDFLRASAEVKGFIDFTRDSEDDYDFFGKLKKFEESYNKYVDIVLKKHDEFKNIEKVKEYFDEELEWFISINMIEKILKYNAPQKICCKNEKE